MALPLLALTLGTTAAGAIAGGSAAKRQARESARREKYNQMMEGLNTRMGVFGGGSGHRLGETDAGPGAGVGAMLGGMGGLQTGLNVYGGMKNLGLGAQMGDMKPMAYLDQGVLDKQTQGTQDLLNPYGSIRRIA